MPTLQCNSGAYTIIGAASLLAFTLGVASEAYTLTGTAVSFVHGYRVTAVPGSYTLTGQLIQTRRISAEPAGYILNGTSASLIRGATTYTLPAATTSYTYTGGTTVLQKSNPATNGTYTLVGVAATLIRASSGSKVIAADSGGYTVSGTAATLRTAVVIDSGEYLLAGTSATLRKGKGVTGLTGAYLIAAPTALTKRGFKFPSTGSSYTYTGSVVNLRYSPAGAKFILIDSGLFTVTGTPVGLSVKSNPISGVYAITGTAAGLKTRLAALSEAYTLTGTPVTFTVTNIYGALPGAYVITGSAATLRGPGPNIVAIPGTYSVAGFSASTVSSRPLTAVNGAYSLVGQPVTLRTSAIHSEVGQYTLTGSTVLLLTTHKQRWRKNPKQPAATTRQLARASSWDAQQSSPGV